ncbi:S1 family peptidase [Streptosporangium sp. 'caverna']|uniref:S1 family peptidase n=1 Tax=Streptosporangium sp. 'caverna' TaxID=2202249 RepID=UPI000D7D8E30|nr:S1 family peptidase [Streptosporangium sp. 'caverna']AWS47235.1 serine protease [Streptosporangium sp. 'caverna']
MSRRHAVTAGCVLAITALTLTAAPVAAQPQTTSSHAASAGWKPPPGMIAALQRDLKLTAEQAQARLLNEARLAPVEAKLRSLLGDRFGGSWFTGTIAQTLVVATTDPADLPQIIAAGAQGEVVKRSYTELSTAMDGLDDNLPGHANGGAVRYVDVRNNRIVVLTTDPLVTEDLIQASGVDSSMVRPVPSTEKPRLFDDVRGGDAYYIGSASRCSIGFAVTRGAQNGFASAGHCGKAGETTTGVNRAAQGVFQASSFPVNDYAWVAVNATWMLRPVVNNGSGGTIPVVGSRAAIEGASVCRSGSTTGWHCGTIQQRDTSVTYPQGTIYELTRTSVCAEPGDSGGSFISVDQAQGVTSGGSGNCSDGGVTYFQPINEILTTYGLSLVTTTGTTPPGVTPPGTTPPGAGTCTGLPKNVTGTLTNGQSVYQPNNRNYQTTVAGVHSACLDAADGVDFDLFLEKWNGRTWATVATSDSPNPDEKISYSGAPGYYRYRVVSASGSGSYKLGYKTP